MIYWHALSKTWKLCIWNCFPSSGKERVIDEREMSILKKTSTWATRMDVRAKGIVWSAAAGLVIQGEDGNEVRGSAGYFVQGGKSFNLISPALDWARFLNSAGQCVIVLFAIQISPGLLPNQWRMKIGGQRVATWITDHPNPDLF
jgi:hypothetical protein